MGIKSIIKKIVKPNIIINCPIVTIKESDKLKDKNIIVTGGSSGIGKQIAIMAAEYKANVLIVGRSENNLKRLAQYNGCKYLVYDLNNPITDDFFFKAEKLLEGEITSLVNNAGVYVDYNSLNYTEEDFNKIFSVNVKAPFLLSQLFVKYCIEKKIHGNIVFTTSNRGLMGDDGPYGMSKSAINNFIEGLARENIVNGIRVNGVAPGMTASAINHINPEENMYTNSSKGKRVLRAEEIANVACYLLSDESKVITGAVIPCDDGDRLR